MARAGGTAWIVPVGLLFTFALTLPLASAQENISTPPPCAPVPQPTPLPEDPDSPPHTPIFCPSSGGSEPDEDQPDCAWEQEELCGESPSAPDASRPAEEAQGTVGDAMSDLTPDRPDGPQEPESNPVEPPGEVERPVEAPDPTLSPAELLASVRASIEVAPRIPGLEVRTSDVAPSDDDGPPIAESPRAALAETVVPRATTRHLADGLVLTAMTLGLLLYAPLSFLYNRLNRHRTERHAHRQHALDFLASRPGATCAEVAAALGVHFTTAKYHLRMLVRFRLVVAFEHRGNRQYFLNDGRFPPSTRAHAVLSREPSHVACLQAARSSGAVRSRDVAAQLQMASAAARYRLRTLARAGLLEQRDDGFALTAQGATFLESLPRLGTGSVDSPALPSRLATSP